MIIDTKSIVREMGVRYIEENQNLNHILKVKDKIANFLKEKNKIYTTKEIEKDLCLKGRTVRKSLQRMENQKIITRIKGKQINNNFRLVDSWKMKEYKVTNKVPKNKICIFYKTNHTNNGYKNHYILLPSKINRGSEFLSAIGFFDAEGSKTKIRSLEAVNSKPELINIFIKLLEHLDVNKEELSYRITFNKNLINTLKLKKKDIENQAKNFWSKSIKIPLNKNIKFNYTGLNKGKLRKYKVLNGSLNINHNSILLRNFFFSLLRYVKTRIKKKEDKISYLRGFFSGEAYVGNHDREIQIASVRPEELNFIKSLLEDLNITCSICKRTSTSPQKLIIANLRSFLILESCDIFRFHSDKKVSLLEKILNYKKLDEDMRIKLNDKLREIAIT